MMSRNGEGDCLGSPSLFQDHLTVSLFMALIEAGEEPPLIWGTWLYLPLVSAHTHTLPPRILPHRPTREWALPSNTFPIYCFLLILSLPHVSLVIDQPFISTKTQHKTPRSSHASHPGGAGMAITH